MSPYTLWSHSYLLHSENQLFRLQNDNKKNNLRFTTPIDDNDDNNNTNKQKNENKKKVLHNINFGVSVLEWFKYGEKPTFNNL